MAENEIREKTRALRRHGPGDVLGPGHTLASAAAVSVAVGMSGDSGPSAPHNYLSYYSSLR